MPAHCPAESRSLDFAIVTLPRHSATLLTDRLVGLLRRFPTMFLRKMATPKCEAWTGKAPVPVAKSCHEGQTNQPPSSNLLECVSDPLSEAGACVFPRVFQLLSNDTPTK